MEYSKITIFKRRQYSRKFRISMYFIVLNTALWLVKIIVRVPTQWVLTCVWNTSESRVRILIRIPYIIIPGKKNRENWLSLSDDPQLLSFSKFEIKHFYKALFKFIPTAFGLEFMKTSFHPFPYLSNFRILIGFVV